MITIGTFVHILDLIGTFVFAISGAVAAVNRRLDIFGILLLSFVAVWRFGPGRGGLVFRPSLHGDQIWLAPAGRPSVRAAARRGRLFG